MLIKKTKTILIPLLLFALLCLNISPFSAYADEADTTSNGELEADLDLYEKHEKYLKYKKYKKYKEYKEAKEKYAFENSTQRIAAKKAYDLYKETKNQRYYEDYNKYKKYKNKYKPLKKYAKYGKYKKYNKSENKRYGGNEYKEGHARYKNYLSGNTVTGDLGEADLGGGPLGPEITVGLWSYSRDNLKKSPFKIQATKDYLVKNMDGVVVAQVPAAVTTRVTYESDGNLKIYNDSISGIISAGEVFFEALDGDNSSMIFDAHRPDSDFDQYRGKMKLRYNSSTKITWVINTLPLEHYVWGMGEITGTGPSEYNKVMTTSFRTYGYWKLKFSTKFLADGFRVNATPGNQLYYGYDWETGHTRIREGAQTTQGRIVMHRGEIAITPYSSWTDGRTRSFEERWGSDNYPWCQSVDDPYGKHPTKDTSTLENEGNHMVGLSAHGALDLADDHNKNWDYILNYYYKNITLKKVY